MKDVVKKWNGISLILRILIGLIIGAVLGLAVPQATAISVLGDLFVGALKAIAPVLVFVLVMSSLAKAGNGIGKRFRTVIFLYMLSTLLAAVVAVAGQLCISGNHQADGCGQPGGAGRYLGGIDGSAE